MKPVYHSTATPGKSWFPKGNPVGIITAGIFKGPTPFLLLKQQCQSTEKDRNIDCISEF